MIQRDHMIKNIDPVRFHDKRTFFLIIHTCVHGGGQKEGEERRECLRE